MIQFIKQIDWLLVSVLMLSTKNEQGYWIGKVILRSITRRGASCRKIPDAKRPRKCRASSNLAQSTFCNLILEGEYK